MYLVTAEQMRVIDQKAINEYNTYIIRFPYNILAKIFKFQN